MRIYEYIGPKHLANSIGIEPDGVPIYSPDDVRAWVQNTTQELSDGCVVATFVVNMSGVMLISDRLSEHVICAGGHPVRSAGEIVFSLGRSVEVVEVSNQSTGYCPEPESWMAVAEALLLAGLSAPEGFMSAYDFRRCVGCGGINLIKENVFECGVCGMDLPVQYNVQ